MCLLRLSLSVWLHGSICQEHGVKQFSRMHCGSSVLRPLIPELFVALDLQIIDVGVLLVVWDKQCFINRFVKDILTQYFHSCVSASASNNRPPPWKHLSFDVRIQPTLLVSLSVIELPAGKLPRS